MKNKDDKYLRLYNQLESLLLKSPNITAKMATINAVLYHKMKDFFWVGFYLLNKNSLVVGPYQGALACQILETNKGVCWAGINKKETIIVGDVSKFPGHIACDSRSKSEIVVPLFDENHNPIAILDIDSAKANHFDEIDKAGLERILSLM